MIESQLQNIIDVKNYSDIDNIYDLDKIQIDNMMIDMIYKLIDNIDISSNIIYDELLIINNIYKYIQNKNTNSDIIYLLRQNNNIFEYKILIDSFIFILTQQELKYTNLTYYL